MSIDPTSEPLLASGSYDHTIKLWQPYSGVCFRTMQHTDSVNIVLDFTFLIDNKINIISHYVMITLSIFVTVTTNLLITNTATCSFVLSQQVNALDVSPSRTLLAACGYQHIRLYDMNSNNPIVNFEGVSKNITRLGFQVSKYQVYGT